MIDILKVDDMYREWKISKGNGKFRHICAPVEELKTEQRCILDKELADIKVHECAYGFVRNCSIKDNAKEHLGRSILAMDLRDFFDTITREQVLNSLVLHGMDKEKALYISKVCTRKGVLPQGAPTSPTLSNIVAKPMDKKLFEFCKSKGLKYTRYADDITISAVPEEYNTLLEIKPQVDSIINKYGFTINGSKTHTQGENRSKNVTGITINKVLNVTGSQARNYRSVIHTIRKKIEDGTIDSFEKLEEKFESWPTLYGYANFMANANSKYGYLLGWLQEIRISLKKCEVKNNC